MVRARALLTGVIPFVAACAGGSPSDGGTTATATTASIAASSNVAACPKNEPANKNACTVPASEGCTYALPTSRTVHCSCIGSEWSCGVPLGIDVTAPAGSCPSEQPKDKTKCSLPERDATNNRPGCFYEVAMSVTHDCLCEHYADGHAVWDCGQRSFDGPFAPNGCPSRQPLEETTCTQAPGADCQYGYNLSTTCRCKPKGDATSTWTCETTPQPPSPGSK